MLPMDEAGLRALVEKMIADAQKDDPKIIEANVDDIGKAAASPQPPIPGARQAPNGEWYMLDPTRRGKYLRVGMGLAKPAGPGAAGAGGV